MKKLSAHYVFDGQHLRRNAVLEIDDDGKIIGLSGERQNFTESENLAFYNGIILPGIINMHQHLELAWMKDRITKKTEMAGFLSAVAALRNNIPVADAVINEMKTLDAIMYNRGIQAVLDISNSSNSISVKKSSNIKYFTAVELYGLDNEQTQKIIEKGQDVLNQFIANNLEAVLSPHSFYLVSHELMKAILQKSRTLVSIHLMESEQEAGLNAFTENELAEFLRSFYTDFSVTNDYVEYIQTNLQEFIKRMKVILVHNTCIPEEMVQMLMASACSDNLFFCLCPRSNRFITGKLPDINMLKLHGCRLLLGSDSPASSSLFNFAEEMRELQHDYPDLSLAEMLQWCTYNAADAIGYSNTLGSFKAGTSPGVVLLENVNFTDLKLTDASLFRRLH